MKKKHHRFHYKTSINISFKFFFFFWLLLLLALNYDIFHLKESSFVFWSSKRQSSSSLLPADVQLFKLFFHLVVCGDIPSVQCPTHTDHLGALEEVSGCLSPRISGDSCLVTLQSFCSLPSFCSLHQSHQTSNSVSRSFDCLSLPFVLTAAKNQHVRY